LKIEPAIVRGDRRRALVDEFISEKLRPDGLFLLRLIQSNSGDIVTCELIATLWHKFVSAHGSQCHVGTRVFAEVRKMISRSVEFDCGIVSATLTELLKKASMGRK
uniref:Innexin n=1 Tax=Parascaris equorum TaxID=6256 RepID=A0A914RGE1_PAREQ